MTERSDTARGLPRGLVLLLGAAATVVVVAGLKGIAGIVAPAFLALVLTIGFHPLRGWLRRRGLPGWVVTILMMMVVYSVLLGLAVGLALAIARFATLLTTYGPAMTRLARDATEWLASIGVGEDRIRATARAVDPTRFVGIVGDLFTGLLSGLSNLVFVVVLLFFLALDAAWFSERLRAMERRADGVVSALMAFASGTRQYLIVSTVFGAIVAALDVGLLYLLGIPAPLLWGLLSFVTNYIPNVGFFIGLVPPAVLGLLEYGPEGLVAVVVGYCLLNFVIQSLIQPRFVGQAVGLATTLTFLSLVFWVWVLGALGALLAIPLSLLAKALLVDSDPRTRRLGDLLTGVTARGRPARRQTRPGRRQTRPGRRRP
ncbi:AI-2E family transporter [Actinopolymorpha pittospori]|uniref:PurR-regulated permease PerM n=1 Tax=Actinopolymorpha pittospori TaxID=648752 RepID=A0A927REF6_9ACTN|nr:putative PurR-regulated permease PerM [Actinopolymorpha pittospori]